MSGETVLVTGGAGFIGCHLVEALLAAGERVRILDNLDPLAHPSGEAPAHLPADAELVVGDLREPRRRRARRRRLRPRLPPRRHRRQRRVDGERAQGDRLQLGRHRDADRGVDRRRDEVRRLVVACSMVVYGEGSYRCSEHGEVAAGVRPVEQLRERRWEPGCPLCGRELEPIAVLEERPLRPISVYGISKRDTEELALVLGEAYGLETVALRYLNTYGPRQALGNPYTGVAAIFSARLLAGKRPLVFEDGRQIRDPIHVSDVVAATRAAMEAPGAAGGVFNVAAGGQVRIAELAETLAGLIAPELQPEITGEFRAGDMRHCWASTDAARETLGFEARVDARRRPARAGRRGSPRRASAPSRRRGARRAARPRARRLGACPRTL